MIELTCAVLGLALAWALVSRCRWKQEARALEYEMRHWIWAGSHLIGEYDAALSAPSEQSVTYRPGGYQPVPSTNGKAKH